MAIRYTRDFYAPRWSEWSAAKRPPAAANGRLPAHPPGAAWSPDGGAARGGRGPVSATQVLPFPPGATLALHIQLFALAFTKPIITIFQRWNPSEYVLAMQQCKLHLKYDSTTLESMMWPLTWFLTVRSKTRPSKGHTVVLEVKPYLSSEAMYPI